MATSVASAPAVRSNAAAVAWPRLQREAGASVGHLHRVGRQRFQAGEQRAEAVYRQVVTRGCRRPVRKRSPSPAATAGRRPTLRPAVRHSRPAWPCAGRWRRRRGPAVPLPAQAVRRSRPAPPGPPAAGDRPDARTARRPPRRRMRNWSGAGRIKRSGSAARSTTSSGRRPSAEGFTRRTFSRPCRPAIPNGPGHEYLLLVGFGRGPLCGRDSLRHARRLGRSAVRRLALRDRPRLSRTLGRIS